MSRARELLNKMSEGSRGLDTEYIDVFRDLARSSQTLDNEDLSATINGFIEDLTGDPKKDLPIAKKFTGWLKANASNPDVVGDAKKKEVMDWIDFIHQQIKTK